ncbi:OPT family oligopeptide transporter [uncultured Nevskia sp.]|uniref:OPT family oligopeptide transporter n=1 Tax=uncultured Nevskia sp. TaxID=228950 RepID=UPI0025CBA775|nr:oligopeptide transporter, OPT family [uncultured Nevskia sp.]
MSSLPDKVPVTAPEPFIAADRQIAEFTVRAVVLGTLLGMVFGASSLYLVLKVGLTVSASIPVAVIAITLFRLVSKAGGRDSTILENNIVQTAGSAGESIAFGLGVTLPAILILGFDLDILRVLLVGVLGGLLGILMMIPLRRSLIVAQHETLKYPEGTACAEVLKASELSKGSADDSSANASRAGIIFAGFGIGLLYKALNVAFKGWKDVPEHVFGAPLKAGSVSCEISPELLGVGYIIGPRIAALMCAGGVLAYLLLIPMIAFFGDALTVPLAPGVKLIRDMSPDDIRGAYVLYVGAGAVAAGGIVSLIRAIPMIWLSLRDALRSFGGAGVGQNSMRSKRTDQDIPMKWVLIGSLLLVVAIMLATPLHMNLLGALLILVFGFLFSTVSSQLTGEIGSSSNPISGMTVATLLFTCLIFLLVGWTGGPYYVTALSVGAIVCIASSNAGTTSQDLKTGYLVGGTPRLQQYAILFGALASALMLGPILIKLNDAATVYVPIAQVAPGLSTDAAPLTETATLQGPQAAQDAHRYRVWHKTDLAGGPAGKYLVDDQGKVVYLVDPGINGSYKQRPDGSEVRKYDAPKAVLMSYIIKGILDRQLPWALVLFGVMIALVLEMSGVPSLAFAVGVYLPLSSSMPIFVGGMVRWAVDRRRNRQAEHRNATADERNAAGDRSPGVLMASGYIAGGALAGIIIAFTAGVLSDFDSFITDWSTSHNPFFEGANADLFSVLPYALLIVVLYWAGREAVRPPPKA